MKLLSALIVLVLVILPAHANTPAPDPGGPDLAYLELANAQRPPRNPELLFVLMGHYANANLQERGVTFFTTRLQQFDHQLTDPQRALYLSVIALLRAQHARQVSLFQRLGYVNDTIAMLERARKLSGGQVYVVNWTAALIDAQLPSLFRRRAAALDELNWCLAHADQAPHSGWLREIYRNLARRARDDGDSAKAQDYLKRSGYPDMDLPITLITPYTEDAATGHSFFPRRVREVVPHRVYALSGFEFTEYYFVVSNDGRELIGIDAGTRPDSAQAAYTALRVHAHDLPPLTTIFVTHSHWDHIGGQAYFRSLNPRLRIYARSNYQDEITRELDAPAAFVPAFFGARFQEAGVRTFKPDVLVDGKTTVTVGGTRVDLIPVRGGETHDAMFIHLPELSTLFVGDFIMPYLGAPFVAEGDPQGLLDAIDVLGRLQPAHILHGHEPLTHNFASAPQLVQLKDDLSWLREQVTVAMQRGETRAVVHAANLVPPALRSGEHEGYLPYLLLREHMIDRIFSQNGGYWQADLQGIDHLGPADNAALFMQYLALSDGQVLDAAKRLVDDGRYELAAHLLEACRARLAHTPARVAVERLVYLKLMEKYQNEDPFKFILYANKAGMQVPPVASVR